MEKIVEATFDGEVIRLDEPLDAKPDTRVKVVIEEPSENRVYGSFLSVARSLKLRGPSDFSKNLDDYLYGGKQFPDEE